MTLSLRRAVQAGAALIGVVLAVFGITHILTGSSDPGQAPPAEVRIGESATNAPPPVPIPPPASPVPTPTQIPIPPAAATGTVAPPHPVEVVPAPPVVGDDDDDDDDGGDDD